MTSSNAPEKIDAAVRRVRWEIEDAAAEVINAMYPDPADDPKLNQDSLPAARQRSALARFAAAHTQPPPR